MRLVDPHPRFRLSYLSAMAEFVDSGDERNAQPPSWSPQGDFPGVDFTLEALQAPDVFDALVRFLLEQRDPTTLRPRAFVPFTELWMDEDGEYVGRISFRHELNEWLHEWGGHIGYAVRPSARRRGHASSALAQMLPLCRAHGLTAVLVTCDVDNDASRRTIERNGGRYEDTRQGKLRYWIPLD